MGEDGNPFTKKNGPRIRMLRSASMDRIEMLRSASIDRIEISF